MDYGYSEKFLAPPLGTPTFSIVTTPLTAAVQNVVVLPVFGKLNRIIAEFKAKPDTLKNHRFICSTSQISKNH